MYLLQFSQRWDERVPFSDSIAERKYPCPKKAGGRNIVKTEPVREERSSCHQLATNVILQPWLSFIFLPIFVRSLGASTLLSCVVLYLETTGGVRPWWTQTETGNPVNYQSASPSSTKSPLDSEFIDYRFFFLVFFISKINFQMLLYGTWKRQEAISALYLNTGIINRHNGWLNINNGAILFPFSKGEETKCSNAWLKF